MSMSCPGWWPSAGTGLFLFTVFHLDFGKKKLDVATVGNAFPDNALLSAQAGGRDLAYYLDSRLNYQPFGHFYVKCSLLWFSHS